MCLLPLQISCPFKLRIEAATTQGKRGERTRYRQGCEKGYSFMFFSKYKTILMSSVIYKAGFSGPSQIQTPRHTYPTATAHHHHHHHNNKTAAQPEAAPSSSSAGQPGLPGASSPDELTGNTDLSLRSSPEYPAELGAPHPNRADRLERPDPLTPTLVWLRLCKSESRCAMLACAHIPRSLA